MSDEQEKAKLYAFEIESGDNKVPPPSHRTRQDATQAMSALLLRLDLPKGATLDEDLRRLFVRYCTDLVLNITWYERARKREQRNNSRLTALMVLIMIIALALLFVMGFTPMLKAPSTANNMAIPFTVFAGGCLTVLQVVATLGDGKARLSIFWKAAADLKEALYTFERHWCGKSVAPPMVPPQPSAPLAAADGFEDAVEDALRAARAITRAERLDFFATLRSPSDVAGIATAAADSLRGRRTEAVTLASDHEASVATARRAATEARACVSASQYRLDNMPDGPDKDLEKQALIKAQAEVIRTEAVLHEVSSA